MFALVSLLSAGQAPSQWVPAPAPPTPCLTQTTIAAWTPPINEPCYVHDSVCVGYPVCCVTRGTCRSQHGGMVSSTPAFYEGGCYSNSSSRRAFAPGCGGKQGECNIPYLQSVRGVTTQPSAITTVPAATLQRLAFEYVQDATPCVTWDVIEVSVVLDFAYIADFSGGTHSGGTDQTSQLCRKIALQVDMPTAYVSCSPTAMGSGRMLHDGGHDGNLAVEAPLDLATAEAAEAAGFPIDQHARKLQSGGGGCYVHPGGCQNTVPQASCTGTWHSSCSFTSGSGCYVHPTGCANSVTQATCAGSWSTSCSWDGTGAAAPPAPPGAPPPPPGPGVVFTAVIQATGTGVTTASVQAGLATHMGTAALAATYLTSSSYTVSISVLPTTIVFASVHVPATPPSPPDSPPPPASPPSPPPSPTPPPSSSPSSPAEDAISTTSSVTTTNLTSAQTADSSSSSLSGGAIAAIVVGCLVLLIVVGAGFAFAVHAKQKKQSMKMTTAIPTPTEMRVTESSSTTAGGVKLADDEKI